VVNNLSLKVKERIDFNRRRVILYAPPLFIIDPQANFWSGTYEFRVNEVNPLGRVGTIRQRVGTKSPHYVIKGKLNFENYFRKWNKYIRDIGGFSDLAISYDSRAVKYIMEYFYTYSNPIIMKAEYDISLVTIDKMYWEQVGEKRMEVSYTLDLYEIRRFPIGIKASSSIVQGLRFFGGVKE